VAVFHKTYRMLIIKTTILTATKPDHTLQANCTTFKNKVKLSDNIFSVYWTSGQQHVHKEWQLTQLFLLYPYNADDKYELLVCSWKVVNQCCCSMIAFRASLLYLIEWNSWSVCHSCVLNHYISRFVINLKSFRYVKYIIKWLHILLNMKQ